MPNLEVNDREFHTILAALRFYQHKGQGNPGNRSDWVDDLATNGDSIVSLSDAEIDELCERLNIGEHQ